MSRERSRRRSRRMRWLGGATGALAFLGLGTAATVFGLSERQFSARPELSHRAAAHPLVDGDPELGARLAVVYGCRRCHGDGLGGRVMVEEPMLGRLVAPNLTALRERYSDSEFATALRHGVRPDGTGLLPAMPAQAFTHLTDGDLAAIVAYVRSVPSVSDSLPPTRVALPLRAMLLFGVLDMVPDLIDHAAPHPTGVDRDDPVALGRYLARSACSECHGPDLRGQEGLMATPHLGLVAAYTLDDFRTLLRTGTALGGRELPTMSTQARVRFAALTDDEIAGLHAFLGALGSASAPPPP